MSRGIQNSGSVVLSRDSQLSSAPFVKLLPNSSQARFSNCSAPLSSRAREHAHWPTASELDSRTAPELDSEQLPNRTSEQLLNRTPEELPNSFRARRHASEQLTSPQLARILFPNSSQAFHTLLNCSRTARSPQ